MFAQSIAMYDLRPYEKPPGDAFLFALSTALITVTADALPLILYVSESTATHCTRYVFVTVPSE